MKSLVTGGTRGIGLAIVRGLSKTPGIQMVYFTGTRQETGLETVKKLKEEGHENVAFLQLDLSDTSSIDVFLKSAPTDIDILINNAGVLRDAWGGSMFKTDMDNVRQTMQINAFGALQLVLHFVPFMKKCGYGRVVNMSSGAGQLTHMNSGLCAYRMSKTAMNAITRFTSEEMKDSNIKVNSMCPGFVNTDMTSGIGAPLTPEQGAETALWLATLPEDGPTGKFFRRKEEMEW